MQNNNNQQSACTTVRLHRVSGVHEVEACHHQQHLEMKPDRHIRYRGMCDDESRQPSKPRRPAHNQHDLAAKRRRLSYMVPW